MFVCSLMHFMDMAALITKVCLVRVSNNETENWGIVNASMKMNIIHKKLNNHIDNRYK